MDFHSRLIDWYEHHKRDLPWRRTKDPYKIWLSEVILQQTRVAQGLSYYEQFVDKYPTVHDLASASEEGVLRTWQGLGYYSRARNLYHTARVVAEEMNGEFPKDYQGLLGLKGVGKYTAAAIASFAYNEPKAVVDGNVQRVLSRIFGIDLPIDSNAGQKRFQELADELLDHEDPGRYNQAIMEFGAMHCVPKAPDCSSCIFNDTCIALQQGKVNEWPIKSKKTRKKHRYFNYLFIDDGGKTYLDKRTGNDIWKNLYEFPLIETNGPVNWKELQKEPFLQHGSWELQEVSGELKHTLTHQQIHAFFWRITPGTTKNEQIPERFISTGSSRMKDYPMSRLMEKYLKNIREDHAGNETLF